MDVRLPAQDGIWALEQIMSGEYGKPPVPVGRAIAALGGEGTPLAERQAA